MCILLLHTNPNPQDNEYRLIVASNRDEYYHRPAKPAFRCPETGVIAGRVTEPGKEGGTWIGFVTKTDPSGNGNITKHRFSCVTNIAGGTLKDAPSRGCFVVDYLEGTADYPEYVSDLKKRKLQYSGYNFIAVELSQNGGITTYHHSNRPQVDSVYTGKHTLGFSNSTISAPFMKVVQGRDRFLEKIEKGFKKEELRDELVALLKDRTYIPDKQLEKRAPKMCSIYNENAETGFGTRTHTVILIDKNWNLEFTEIAMEDPIDFRKPKWNTTVIESQL